MMDGFLEAGACNLRSLQPRDAEAIFRNYASDDSVTRYALWPTHTRLETAQAFVYEALERCETGEEWTWSITAPDANECIGLVSARPSGHKAEIGYVLGQAFWNRGIMTAAVSCFIRWCFSETDLNLLWATCAVKNVASSRVLVKVGMEQGGILRGWHVFPNYSDKPQDCYVYTLLRSAT